jgi:hypothetical protein
MSGFAGLWPLGEQARLTRAAARGDVAGVLAALEQGAQPAGRENAALRAAFRYGHRPENREKSAEIAKLLRSRGAPALGEDANRLLWDGARSDDPARVRQALAFGADRNHPPVPSSDAEAMKLHLMSMRLRAPARSTFAYMVAFEKAELIGIVLAEATVFNEKDAWTVCQIFENAKLRQALFSKAWRFGSATGEVAEFVAAQGNAGDIRAAANAGLQFAGCAGAALGAAARAGNAGAFKELMALGLDPAPHAESLFAVAARRGAIGIIDLLAASGLKPGPEALTEAVAGDSAGAVARLAVIGLDVNTNDGAALIQACSNGNGSAMRALFAAGAEHESRGEALANAALVQPNSDIVAALLDAGVDAAVMARRAVVLSESRPTRKSERVRRGGRYRTNYKTVEGNAARAYILTSHLPLIAERLAAGQSRTEEKTIPRHKRDRMEAMRQGRSRLHGRDDVETGPAGPGEGGGP